MIERHQQIDDANDHSHYSLNKVVASGASLLLAFLVLFLISGPFEYGSGEARPILLTVGLLVAAAIVATWGLGQAIRIPAIERRKLLLVIFAFALSTRLVALFTLPVLEIDYYRYIWDGKVVAAGVSPYSYSPAQILKTPLNPHADSNDESNESGLQSLVQLRSRSESNLTILDRIHYENYTSVYPPVSQFVFATTMNWFPDSASVNAHILAIKFAMLMFDMATLVIICLALRTCKLHLGWSIVYAWNPLVIKEISNSGHLDSIATMCMTFSLFAVLAWLAGNLTDATEEVSDSASDSPIGNRRYWWLLLGGGSLGLGVGAKLFPVVVLPALFVSVAKKHWSSAGLFLLAFSFTAVLVLWPIVSTDRARNESPQETELVNSSEQPSSDQSSKDGFSGFFSSWRMNDPVFSTLYLNLGFRKEDSKRPWFVVSDELSRNDFSDWCRERNLGGKNPAFFLTRLVTLGIFGIFYLWQLFAIYISTADRNSDGVDLAARLCLILSLFLVLQPTVNPWYVVWIVPLACFTRNRGWLLASGFLMFYYGRFWFKSLTGTFQIANTAYSGVGLFDYFIVFVEFCFVIGALLYFFHRDCKNADAQNANANSH